MKNPFLVWIALLYTLLLPTNKLIAQRNAIDLQVRNYLDHTDKATDKKIKGDTKLNSSIKPRAMRHFIHTFKDFEDVDWLQTEKLLIANFTDNNIATRVVYNKNGNWLFSVVHYMENKLPVNIRDIVKRSYLHYTIINVRELHKQDKIVYYVHMEDSKSVKIISVCNNETDVWIAFNKSL